nr:ribonuclease H-like domain-containing protein [Tanacetum cinerariifolium]
MAIPRDIRHEDVCYVMKATTQSNVTPTSPPSQPTSNTLQPGNMGLTALSGASSHLNSSVNSLSENFNTSFGFFVKDFMSRRVLLRCDSSRDLYLVTHSSLIPRAFLVSQHMWHQRLGHLGGDVLLRLVSNNVISYDNEKPHVVCHACLISTTYVLKSLYLRDIELVLFIDSLKKKYVVEILKKAHMVNCNSSRTPVDSESKLGADGDSIFDLTLYRSLAEPHFSALKRVLSAVYFSSNPVQHQRTKHIEIDIHFVHDLVVDGQVLVLHVPSRYQFSDIFTKGLSSALFEEFHTSLSASGECSRLRWQGVWLWRFRLNKGDKEVIVQDLVAKNGELGACRLPSDVMVMLERDKRKLMMPLKLIISYDVMKTCSPRRRNLDLDDDDLEMIGDYLDLNPNEGFVDIKEEEIEEMKCKLLGIPYFSLVLMIEEKFLFSRYKEQNLALRSSSVLLAYSSIQRQEMEIDKMRLTHGIEKMNDEAHAFAKKHTDNQAKQYLIRDAVVKGEKLMICKIFGNAI